MPTSFKSTFINFFIFFNRKGNEFWLQNVACAQTAHIDRLVKGQKSSDYPLPKFSNGYNRTLFHTRPSAVAQQKPAVRQVEKFDLRPSTLSDNRPTSANSAASSGYVSGHETNKTTFKSQLLNYTWTNRLPKPVFFNFTENNFSKLENQICIVSIGAFHVSSFPQRAASVEEAVELVSKKALSHHSLKKCS